MNQSKTRYYPLDGTASHKKGRTSHNITDLIGREATRKTDPKQTSHIGTMYVH